MRTEHTYSGHALDEVKKGWMRDDKLSFPLPSISFLDILAAQRRSSEFVQSPEKIIGGFRQLDRFAHKVMDMFPDEIDGGFIAGIPFALVPTAIRTNNTDVLVIPELKRFHDQMSSELKESLDGSAGPWICVSCMASQKMDKTAEGIDLAYIATHCGSCTEILQDIQKPRKVKYSLVDFDVFFSTKNQLSVNTRKAIWETARECGFSPIYQDLDRVVKGETSPVDIWLFETEEIHHAMREMVNRQDWYKQLAYPYELFRYGTSPISANRLQDDNIATDFILETHPFGSEEFIHFYLEIMKQIVTRPNFLAELQILLTEKDRPQDFGVYLGGQAMWPNHLSRIFTSGRNFHPLLEERIKNLADGQMP